MHDHGSILLCSRNYSVQRREFKGQIATDCNTVGLGSHQQDAYQLVGQAKRRPNKIRPKAVGSGIFDRFANFDKCRSEAAGDVISGAAVD